MDGVRTNAAPLAAGGTVGAGVRRKDEAGVSASSKGRWGTTTSIPKGAGDHRGKRSLSSSGRGEIAAKQEVVQTGSGVKC